MTRGPTMIAIALACACACGPSHTAPPTPVPRPPTLAIDAGVIDTRAPIDAPAPIDAAPPIDAALAVAAVPPPTPPPTAPGMISDADCIAQGGYIDTERNHPRRADRPPAMPFRVCRLPNPKVGHACRGAADCGGARCMCTGALARPNPHNNPALVKLDHTLGTGVCRDDQLMDGAWFCMVEAGRISLSGIIID